MRLKHSRLAGASATGGLLALVVAPALPWAYVGGRPVGIDWIGPPAIVPLLLLALVATIALAVREPGGRWVAGASALGGFAGYVVVAGARAIPTMAAVRESADGSPGPAFLVVIAADAFLTLAVWVGFVALRAGDIHQR